MKINLIESNVINKILTIYYNFNLISKFQFLKPWKLNFKIKF